MKPRSGAACAALTVLVAQLVTVGPAAAEHTIPVDQRDTTAATTRTIPAWNGNPGVQMFSVTFTTTVPNEKRRIRGRVNVSQPATTTDEILMASTQVACAPAGTDPHSLPFSSHDQIGQVQNVLRGQSLTLLPRFVFTAPTPGSYTCSLKVGSLRPRPVDPDIDPQSNNYTVDSGSYVEITTAIPATAKQSYAPDAVSVVLQNQQDHDAAVMDWTAPAGVSSFSVSGDIKLTACTAEGGSTDPVTGIVMCDGLKDITGSTVKTSFMVMQRKLSDPSSYCTSTTIPAPSGRTTFISRDVHHQMLYDAAHVNVSTAADCSRDFRIKIYVKHFAATAVVVHRQGTITAVIPG